MALGSAMVMATATVVQAEATVEMVKVVESARRQARSSDSSGIPSFHTHMPQRSRHSPGGSTRPEHHKTQGIHRQCHTYPSTPGSHSGVQQVVVVAWVTVAALVLGMAMVLVASGSATVKAMAAVVLAEAAVKMEKAAAAARGCQTLRPQRAQDSVRLLSAEWSNIVQHHRPQHMRWCKARHRCQR